MICRFSKTGGYGTPARVSASMQRPTDAVVVKPPGNTLLANASSGEIHKKWRAKPACTDNKYLSR